MIDLNVIICHYSADLEWVKELKFPYTIYNKNPKNEGKYDYDLPNYGYDALAYLTYIIDFYDVLPDFVCFTQDNPFDHCEGFIKRVNSFDGSQNFVPLGKSYVRDNITIQRDMKKFADDLEMDLDDEIKFISGLQLIVSKELIKSRTIEFYKKIREKLNKDKIVSYENYLIEYLWPSIMNFNKNLQVSLKNCI